MYLLLFLLWSFYQDVAAAKRKINAKVNDEQEDIIEEEKGGQGQEWKKMSPNPSRRSTNKRIRQSYHEKPTLTVIGCYFLASDVIFVETDF